MPDGISSDRIPTKVTLAINPKTNNGNVCLLPGWSIADTVVSLLGTEMSKRLTSEPRVRLANTHLDCKAWFVVTDCHQPKPDDFPKLCSPGNFVYDRTGQTEAAFGHPRNGGLICLMEGERNSVVAGKSCPVRVVIGGCRIINKKYSFWNRKIKNM